MNDFTKEMMRIFKTPQPLADEYTNPEDGLLYCQKCHTPRQTTVTLGKDTFYPKVNCRCQQEQMEREKAERDKQELAAKISRLKASGLQDKALLDYTFANDSGINPELQKAHEYVERRPEMRESCTGLLVWGGVGTAKSFFAGCIANALLEQGVPVLMTNFARILNSLTGLYNEKNEFVESFNRYSLLIIDDLGVERNSEFALEQVYTIIDSRYRSKKPLIVTTNLTLEELKHPADIAHERIYDRVLERCVPLKINNENIRQRNAKTNIAKAKELFSTGL